MAPASLCLGITALLVLRAAAGAAPPPAPPAGKRSANLLAGVAPPLRLRPPPTGEGAACSANDTLHAATPDGWALPFGSAAQLSAHLSVAQCGSAGALGSLGALDLYLDCTPGGSALTLSSAGLGSLRYALPPGAAAAGFNATLTQDTAAGAFSLCLDGLQAAPVNGSSAQGGGALLAALATNASLLAGAVALGPRADAAGVAEADVAALWLTDFALPCGGGSGDPGATAAAAAAANRPPVIAAPAQAPAGDVFVGQQVQLTALASDPDGDPLLLRATAYGASLPACIAAECPDVAAAAYGAAGSASVTLAVAYPKPGRYVIRVEASDGGGAVVAWDHPVLVRKVGDVNGSAPCCRLAPGAVAQQLGRPLHDTVFRDESVYRHAATLGWSREYMDGADLEAERLFDYSSLAPPFAASPLVLLSCQDQYLAGAGSPQARKSRALYGTTQALFSATHGHNKKLAILPAGFNWANSTSQLGDCQRHWSGWSNASPGALPAPGGGDACAQTCTQAATEVLMRETSMFDQANQALIAASGGQLSLSPSVAVLPEVSIPRLSSALDNFSYYESPPRQALAASGLPYWAAYVLTPLAADHLPPFRAWSGGLAARGAVATQCYLSQYYAVHELGHVLGFYHPFLMASASAPGSSAGAGAPPAPFSAPADPLGPAPAFVAGASPYADSLDIMACCKSDYSIYHRLMAGWLRGPERAVVSSADLAAPATLRLTLWPFDRPESRGRLQSVTVRRSAGEVLLLGLRSSAYWQDVAVAPDGDLAYEQQRSNVAGLSVEYVRRDAFFGIWSEKGLLDFNALHADWPHALPTQAGGLPRLNQFSLLKPGYSWYDAPSRLLLSLEAPAPCPGDPGLRPWPHAPRGFYGFRGEWPGAEQYQQADYSGYATLECATLVLRTAADPPPASLALSLTLGSAADEPAAGTAPGMKPGTSGSSSLTAAASRRRLQQQAAGGGGGSGCGSSPILRVVPEAGRPVAFVVWRDNLNRTFASGPDALAARLPPPAALEQTAGGRACSAGSCLALARRYSVHVLAEDGGHSGAYFSFVPGGGQLRVLHKSYGPQQLSMSEETLDLGLGGDPWAGCGAAVGSAASSSGGAGGSGGGGSMGVVIGAAVGGAVAAAAVAAGFAWWWRRRRAARHVKQLLVADAGQALDAAAV